MLRGDRWRDPPAEISARFRISHCTLSGPVSSLLSREEYTVSESDARGRWEEFAATWLRYREDQQHAWGDIDDLTLARYLAGSTSESEDRRIQAEMKSHEVLREAVEFMQTLPGLSARPAEVTAGIPAAGQIWQSLEGVWQLPESLRVWIDDQRQVLAAGLEKLGAGPRPLASALLADTAEASDVARAWLVPVPEIEPPVFLSIQITRRQQAWDVGLILIDGEERPISAGDAPTFDSLLNDTEVVFAPLDPDSELMEQVVPLKDLLQWPIPLEAGEWVIRLSPPRVRPMAIPLDLGQR